MQNLLLNIIKHFDLDELKLWRNFVKSPYFNTNQTLIKMADFLARIHPEVEDFNKEKLFKKLYPKKKFANNLLNTNFSRLEQLTFRFLSQEKFKEDESLQDYLLFSYLCSENFVEISDLIDKKWKQSYKNIKNKINKNNLDINEGFYMVNLTKVKKAFEVHKNFFGYTDIDLELSKNILNINNKYYLLEQSKNLSQYIAEFLYLKKDKKQALAELNESEQLMLNNEYFYTNDALTNLYLVLSRLLLDIGNRHRQLNYIYEIVEKKANELKSSDISEIVIEYYNVCGIFDAQQADVRYFEYVSRFDELVLRKKLLSQEFVAIPVIFYRITVSLLYSQKIELLKSFINENKAILHLQDYVYLIIKSQIALLEKDFETAEEYINTLKVLFQENSELKKSIFHVQYSSMLPIKFSYETQDWEQLEKELAAYKVYIHRKQKNISENEELEKERLTEKQQIFVKNMIILVRLRFEPTVSKENLIKFQQKVAQERSPILEKQWLLEKIVELSLLKRKMNSY